MTTALATVLAAVIAYIVAPKIRDRVNKRNTDETRREVAAATIAEATEKRVERLFGEYDRLRSAYREDLGDLRRQLGESNDRIRQLEHEVAEWRSGLHGVVGVWVAVPASVWEFVRASLPNLPATRFPGEVEPSPEHGAE